MLPKPVFKSTVDRFPCHSKLHFGHPEKNCALIISKVIQKILKKKSLTEWGYGYD